VPVEELGGAVHHEISTELDWPLHIGTRERVVHHDERVAGVRDLARHVQVRDSQHGIGRRLEEEHLRVRAKRPFDLDRLRRVHVGEIKLVLSKYPLEEAVGAAIRVVGHDDMIAGLEQRHDRTSRRHAGREAEPRLAALKCRDVRLECRARRILRPGVFVPLVLAYRLLHVRGCLIDRGDDGAG
jgi:hypothetical protein